MNRHARFLFPIALAGLALSACSSLADPTATPTHEEATPSNLAECESLSDFEFEDTRITSAETVEAGEQEAQGGEQVGEHCLVKGLMNERTSSVDKQDYAIGFEMRLPADWSGRYLYQANGGLDGNIVPALGNITGAQLHSGLQDGFAVISSDAGHNAEQNPLFGIDPQARLDYGYQAVGTLTPMAKALIDAAYGRGPDYSYFGGASNGGRHTVVAASRYADQYDGFLAVAPGIDLPKAAGAQLWGAQQWSSIASDPTDLHTAFDESDRQVLADAILTRCDGLDGAEDGMVFDSARCQEDFDLDRDVATCDDTEQKDCLSTEQKKVVASVFAGAEDSSGKSLYSSFPFDPGLAQEDWGQWKFNASVEDRDPAAMAFVFSTPPADPSVLEDTLGYALDFDVDRTEDLINSTSAIYSESAMEFMTPPDPSFQNLHDLGGKMIMAHGASDGVFSPDDTAKWFDNINDEYDGSAADFVRYFEIPGMGHVQGGPATDQFDGLGALVDWVESDNEPDSILAHARGKDNALEENKEVPDSWASDRTRPLCPYPQTAKYVDGDPERAESFECAAPSGS